MSAGEEKDLSQHVTKCSLGRWTQKAEGVMPRKHGCVCLFEVLVCGSPAACKGCLTQPGQHRPQTAKEN